MKSVSAGDSGGTSSARSRPFTTVLWFLIPFVAVVLSYVALLLATASPRSRLLYELF